MSTTSSTPLGCWSATLPGAGDVAIVEGGHWDGKAIKLVAGSNHAKFGVSSDTGSTVTIFGDMNQEGAASGACRTKQNVRGGLFFVLDDQQLHDSVSALLDGAVAPQ